MRKQEALGKVQPGKHNLITDVPGLRVGNAHDDRLRSGVTVLIPDGEMVVAVDSRGGGTGSREFDLLRPEATVQSVNAIVLSGGSAFGLDAAGGVMAALREKGIGYRAGASIVPIVPAAILFDLNNGGDKDWGTASPYPALGRKAFETASDDFTLGNAGAGFGANAGGYKGGLGSVSMQLADGGPTVGALVAVNAVGALTHPVSGAFFAWDSEIDEEFGGVLPVAEDRGSAVRMPKLSGPGENTTIAIVATDAVLTKSQCKQFAIMAHQGLARAIRPANTPFDGDVVFGVSTSMMPLKDPVRDLATLGAHAADCLARAIARGVFEAKSQEQSVSYQDTFGFPCRTS
ncbi:P1 family peptidase [uncultured Nisaea sp.]|uniref:P1 family peptidase n=1 Tax=uncultured Nisaea sp. TaxID=538215 RepID=UPI0030EEC01D|tara:strand:+ start:13884 stop:14921 length:1038 start_codon:yes stop_codon:yes gene_type:complete